MNDFDHTAHEWMTRLVDGGYLVKGTPEYGITMKVLEEGDKWLSPKQRFIWEKLQREVFPLAATAEEKLEAIMESDREAEYVDQLAEMKRKGCAP